MDTPHFCHAHADGLGYKSQWGHFSDMQLRQMCMGLRSEDRRADECIRAVMLARVCLACLHLRAESLRLWLARSSDAHGVHVIGRRLARRERNLLGARLPLVSSGYTVLSPLVCCTDIAISWTSHTLRARKKKENRGSPIGADSKYLYPGAPAMSPRFFPTVVYHFVEHLRRGKAAKLEGPTYGNSNPSVAIRMPCAHNWASRRIAAGLRAKFARVFA